MKLFNLITYLTICCVYQIYAQELPPVKLFSEANYDVASQNWSISQAKNGNVYVANNKGLLEFNGTKSTLYPTPNETIMRSVKVVKDLIFTGFYMDFGYWTNDEFGNLHYTSITKNHQVDILEDEQFWTIIEIDGWILFQSLQRIYLYNLKTEAIKIIDSETSITKMFKVADVIYFQQVNKGIYKIEEGVSKPLYLNGIAKDSKIVLMSEQDDRLVIVTSDKGIYTVDDNNFLPYNSVVNQQLKHKTVYSGVQLEKKAFVLGTISHGLLYIDIDGSTSFEINRKNTLINNTVLAVFEDQRKNLWLGLDDGIGVVNLDSPFRIHKDFSGSLGTVYTSKLFNNTLFLGTNQGLFFKPYKSKEEFQMVQGTQGQVWALKEIKGELLCGHDSGTYLISQNQARQISKIPGSWNFKVLNDTTIVQGNYSGLHVLYKTNDIWRYSHKIKGFDNSSRYFEFVNKNLVLVNHEYKGIFKLKLSNTLKEVTEVCKDTTVNRGLHSSLLDYGDAVLYAFKKGVFKYSENQKRFIKDSVLSTLLSEDQFTSGKLIYDQEANKLWSFSKNNMSYLTPGRLSKEPSVHKVYISERLRKGALGYENIEKLDHQNFLLGVSEGYITLDLGALSNADRYSIKINSILKSKKAAEAEFVNLHTRAELPYEENNITFNYSVPYFGKHLSVNYQYKLLGHTEQWSNWSEDATILFKNLPYGTFTFFVRAKIGNTLSENKASYKFSILRPWYLSYTMLIFYVLSVFMFSILMHYIYKMYYNSQREKLLEAQEKEFKFRALANEKKLMSLKNDQLKSDVDSKNRELAISTMSVIKKNEFLNTIKGELKNSKEIPVVHKVIKIIDQNINNTDDWKMFKEAFNNADKDFIKKLKDLHPSLTPNDLRLCAYLRLNLTSKEIAPLLNISPRSVEVKRYRLRKKMNLPHDVNLTSYILEIK